MQRDFTYSKQELQAREEKIVNYYPSNFLCSRLQFLTRKKLTTFNTLMMNWNNWRAKIQTSSWTSLANVKANLWQREVGTSRLSIGKKIFSFFSAPQMLRIFHECLKSRRFSILQYAHHVKIHMFSHSRKDESLVDNKHSDIGIIG